MSAEIHEVYAIKYATREGTRSGNFIGGDPHDGPMPMEGVAVRLDLPPVR